MRIENGDGSPFPEAFTVTSRQGKITIAAAVLVLSSLLLREALSSSDWMGFAITELQILLPMSISWWVMSARRKAQ